MSALPARRNAIAFLCGVAVLAGVLGCAWIMRYFLSAAQPVPNNPTFPSQRRETVQHLRAVRDALQRYQDTHGQLPVSLDELGVSSEMLRDGAGHQFVYTNHYLEQANAPGRDILLVSLQTPVGHFPILSEKWWYAIYQSGTNAPHIRAWSDAGHSKP